MQATGRWLQGPGPSLQQEPPRWQASGRQVSQNAAHASPLDRKPQQSPPKRSACDRRLRRPGRQWSVLRSVLQALAPSMRANGRTAGPTSNAALPVGRSPHADAPFSTRMSVGRIRLDVDGIWIVIRRIRVGVGRIRLGVGRIRVEFRCRRPGSRCRRIAGHGVLPVLACCHKSRSCSQPVAACRRNPVSCITLRGAGRQTRPTGRRCMHRRRRSR